MNAAAGCGTSWPAERRTRAAVHASTVTTSWAADRSTETFILKRRIDVSGTPEHQQKLDAKEPTGS